jgi:hypothetical protein
MPPAAALRCDGFAEDHESGNFVGTHLASFWQSNAVQPATPPALADSGSRHCCFGAQTAVTVRFRVC